MAVEQRREKAACDTARLCRSLGENGSAGGKPNWGSAAGQQKYRKQPHAK
jgi:hypothetical protein